MYSRAILISILAAMVSSNVSASLIPAGSSDVAAMLETRDIITEVAPAVNEKRHNGDDHSGKDAKVKAAFAARDAGDAGAGEAGGAGGEFGKCKPDLIFKGGLGNRPATEFTFQSSDPTCKEGQGEALNPNIITNHIKDVVNTKCGATDAGKAKVAAAVEKIKSLGTKDQTTADAWNKALGLA